MANAKTVNPLEVQKFLKDVDYPATKDDLIVAAELEGADGNVLNTIRRIPFEAFESPNDVAGGIAMIDDDGEMRGDVRGDLEDKMDNGIDTDTGKREQASD